MSKLVDDLLNFFERREGTHVSAGDVEEVMEAAAMRIEELEKVVGSIAEMSIPYCDGYDCAISARKIAREVMENGNS